MWPHDDKKKEYKAICRIWDLVETPEILSELFGIFQERAANNLFAFVNLKMLICDANLDFLQEIWKLSLGAEQAGWGSQASMTVETLLTSNMPKDELESLLPGMLSATMLYAARNPSTPRVYLIF